MCTLLFAHLAHPDIPLLIAANRDEFYARRAERASFWTDRPHILAGRDRKADGTWLGITRTGRWAGLTNIRHPGHDRRDARSRGQLVSAFLDGAMSPEAYARAAAAAGAEYNGFNLLVGDGERVWYASNYLSRFASDHLDATDGVCEVKPGIHGVSNHLLDTAWPKVEHGRTFLRAALEEDLDILRGDTLPTRLLDELASARPFADERLPDTGVGIEWERKLSSLFVATPLYGTCCSTVIAVHQSGQVRFVERTTNPTIPEPALVIEQFALES